jgi:hypothetical protein
MKDYITESKHGLAYHVGGSMVPVSWKDPEDYLADQEKAAQLAFGTDFRSALKLKGKENVNKFRQALFEVIKAKMRGESMRALSSSSEELRGSARRNAERKRQHPDWPSHICGASESLPVGRLQDIEEYCKYCHQTHRNWWMMDQRDYQIEGLTIVLCGECGHTHGWDIFQK